MKRYSRGCTDQIVAFKRKLAPNRDVLRRAYADVKGHINRGVDRIRRDAAAGRPVVPELDYQDIRNGKVPEDAGRSIRSSGCAVIRGVFPAPLASGWFAEVGEYLETNRYEDREVEKRSLDKYFSALKTGKPQIFNVYWSRPQVMARQDASSPRRACFWIGFGNTKAPSIPTCSVPMPTGSVAGSRG